MPDDAVKEAEDFSKLTLAQLDKKREELQAKLAKLSAAKETKLKEIEAIEAEANAVAEELRRLREVLLGRF